MSIKRALNAVKKEEKQIVASKKNCIVCTNDAEYCMRGLPENTYCKECAKEYFKLLGYLEKL